MIAQNSVNHIKPQSSGDEVRGEVDGEETHIKLFSFLVYDHRMKKASHKKE